MEMISVGSSSYSYTSPTWTPGIITIILILQETEALGGHNLPQNYIVVGGDSSHVLWLCICNAHRISCDDGSILYLYSPIQPLLAT